MKNLQLIIHALVKKNMYLSKITKPQVSFISPTLKLSNINAQGTEKMENY